MLSGGYSPLVPTSVGRTLNYLILFVNCKQPSHDHCIYMCPELDEALFLSYQLWINHMICHMNYSADSNKPHDIMFVSHDHLDQYRTSKPCLWLSDHTKMS